MVICECLGLTDRAVREKLKAGACRLSDFVPKAALRSSCGACFEVLKKLIHERDLEARASSAALPAPPQDFVHVG
jgi:bacterioferritin-associated ferredoxin